MSESEYRRSVSTLANDGVLSFEIKDFVVKVVCKRARRHMAPAKSIGTSTSEDKNSGDLFQCPICEEWFIKPKAIAHRKERKCKEQDDECGEYRYPPAIGSWESKDKNKYRFTTSRCINE